MDISEKVAYIRGLADGIELDKKKNEGRIIYEMLDLLGLIGDNMTDLSLELDSLLFSEGYPFTEGAVEAKTRVKPQISLASLDFEDEALEDYEGDVYEVTCPYCSETITLLEDDLDECAVDCPICQTLLTLDFTGPMGAELLGDVPLP